MVEYKLSIIRTAEGKYQVSHYHKMEPEEIPDFPSLVNKILSYSDLKVFGLDPTIVGCSKEEETAIRKIRQLVLEKGELESKLLDDSDIPF